MKAPRITILLMSIGVLFYIALACQNISRDESIGKSPIRFTQKDSVWQLLRNEIPYEIKGVYGAENFQLLKKIGGNSVMLHHTELSDSILNLADSLELSVSVTIDIGKIRFTENNYEDSIFLFRQRQMVSDLVQQYHSHPALLFWIIGNETHIMNKYNKVLWSEINTLSKLVHEIDTIHLTTTTIAAYPTISYQPMQVKLFAPDLDFLSLTIYESVDHLNRELKSFIWGYDGPILVAEWAGLPYWKSPVTEWGVFIEPSTTTNADFYAANYVKIFEQNKKQCFGGYAFYWGQKQERTHTIFTLLQEGKYKTEAVEKLQYFWGGTNLTNWCPRIKDFTLGNGEVLGLHYLTLNTEYPVWFNVVDPDGDEMFMKWEIRTEGHYSGKTGGEAELGTSIISSSDSLLPYIRNFSVRTPKETGPYRLFAYVYDTAGYVASVNIPFYVLPE